MSRETEHCNVGWRPARVLAEERGWPLLAEPSSGSRTGTHAIRTYRLLLGDESLAGRIRRVVVAGHPTLSRPVTRLLSREDVEVVALADGQGGWTDPGHRVSRVLAQAPLLAARADRPALGPSRCAANIPARSPSLKLLSPAPSDPLEFAPEPATLSYVGKSRKLESGMIPPPKNPRLAMS